MEAAETPVGGVSGHPQSMLEAALGRGAANRLGGPSCGGVHVLLGRTPGSRGRSPFLCWAWHRDT